MNSPLLVARGWAWASGFFDFQLSREKAEIIRHASVAEGIGLDEVDFAADETNTRQMILDGIDLPLSIR